MILHVYLCQCGLHVNLKAWGMWSCDFLFGGGLWFKCPEMTFWRWRRRQKNPQDHLYRSDYWQDPSQWAHMFGLMHLKEPKIPTLLDVASFPLSSPCCFGWSPLKAWTFFAKAVVANNVSFSLSSEISMVKRLGFCFFSLLVLWRSRNVMKHSFLVPSTSGLRQPVYICTRFCKWYSGTSN